MKTIFLFVFSLFLQNYQEAIQMGGDAFKKRQYRKAKDFYFSAETFDPSQKQGIRKKIDLSGFE